MTSRHSKLLHLDTAVQRCPGACGFYGNPEWDGFCSQCRKKNAVAGSPTAVISVSDVPTFEKFEKKRSTQKPGRISSGGPKFSKNKVAGKLTPVEEEFQRFLHELPSQLQPELKRRVREFLAQIEERCDSLEATSNTLQRVVWPNLESFLRGRDPYRRMSAIDLDENITKIGDAIEIYISSSLHDNFVDVASKEEEDQLFKARTLQLHWLEPRHLGMKIDESDPQVQPHMQAAVDELLVIDTKLSTLEKLQCLERCFKALHQAMSSKNSPLAADDLMGLVILVLLRSRPSRLHTNLTFISQFSLRDDRYDTGMAGYIICTCRAAIQAIERLRATDLSCISAAEFDRRIQGDYVPTTGELRQQLTTSLEALRHFQEENRRKLAIPRQHLQDFAEEYNREMEALKAEVELMKEELARETRPKLYCLGTMDSDEERRLLAQLRTGTLVALDETSTQPKSADYRQIEPQQQEFLGADSTTPLTVDDLLS